MNWLTKALCVVGLGLLPADTYAQDQAIIVLDGSGSMWGQIQGTPKISIARDVLANVLGNKPKNLSLGLMSYGHRQKGDCGDIELIVQPGEDTSVAISNAANDISPKGKTPLSDAVTKAAESLKYQEDKATVILITDGIETCRADPCALAKSLEKTGIDFTVHVVGFGLSAEEGKQVACLAEETGGQFIQADDAGSLGAALSETVEEAAAPALEPQPEPTVVAEAGKDEKIETPTASITAPETVEMGRRFEVSWEGPADKYDDIHLFDPASNNGDGKRLRGKRLRNTDLDAKQFALVAPATPGPYLLRYYFGPLRTIIATRAIEIVEADVSLSAPATVDIGRRFDVTWVGPGGKRDVIEIVDPTGNQGEGKALRGKRLSNGKFDEQQVTLVAPAKPGFYRLRYWSGVDRIVLATREIEILEAEVSVSALQEVAIGFPIHVDWVGPGGRRDSVQVFSPQANGGQGKVMVEKRLTNGKFDENKVSMPAPAKPGSYILRYWNGENRTVLATRPIEIISTEVSLEAADSIKIARQFDVKWVGPAGSRDAIELYDPDTNAGRGKVLKTRRLSNGDMDNQIVKLDAVARPGTYQLRYWNGDNRVVLATRPVEIVGMQVEIDAPESVEIGQKFAVYWEGPGAPRDSILIVDPTANGGKGRELMARRLTGGRYDDRSLDLVAPKKAGKYVLRYMNTANRAVLAERAISVK